MLPLAAKLIFARTPAGFLALAALDAGRPLASDPADRAPAPPRDLGRSGGGDGEAAALRGPWAPALSAAGSVGARLVCPA